VESISFLSKDQETLAKIETHYVDLEGDSLFFDIGGKLHLVYYSPQCQCIVLKHLTKDGKTIKDFTGVTVQYDVRGNARTPKKTSATGTQKKSVTWAEFFRGWI
jgi:hypothetical protein